jgi:hypothetical protein
MNRLHRSAAICLLPLAAFAADAQAESRCAAPRSSVDARACSLAQLGPEQLRRFVQRTQSIHHLNFQDYATEADYLRWAERETRRAPRERRAVSARAGVSR